MDRVRRGMDVVVAGAVLGLGSPVLAALAVAVRLRLGSPVLFRQRRAGLAGAPFELVKFRTMTDGRDADGTLLADADRLGPFGRWLRSTSLDELPELWNVLRGDMTLVGPRPLPVHYLERYSAAESRRHDVKPGVTGWAQVNGRNSTGWDERLALDIWYVEHRSLRLDVRILVRTIAAVLGREGIAAEGEATMSELPPLSERAGRPA